MKDKFVSILSDYGFKVAFADEKDTLFLRKSLQALIQLPRPIKEVHFVRNEFSGITEERRGGLYDLICEDEHGDTFIVEMQLGYYKHYMQRAKFYAFQKFNTIVEKGKFFFDDLSKIYCIGLLAKSIFSSEQYYHYGTLTNQVGEVMDTQMVHIIVEISKFNKSINEVETDLDKLLYTMKNLEEEIDLEPAPPFYSEEWIDKAIEKLKKSNMTSEQRMWYQITVARNVSVMQMNEEEKRRSIEEEVDKIVEKEKRKLIQKAKRELAEKAEQEKRKLAEKAEREKIKALEEEKIQMAKNLKASGVATEIIARSLNLLPETIEKL